MMSLSQLGEKNPLLALKMQSAQPVNNTYNWNIELDGIDVLFAYGAGDGSLYGYVKPWLKNDAKRQLVWIAQSAGDAWGFTGVSDAQVTHCTLEEIEVLKNAVWKTVLMEAGWACPEAVRKEIEMLRMGIQLLLFKARDFGKQELLNVLENAGDKKVARPNQLKGQAAIVCGSGPSLDIEQLAQFQDKAYIFAGGSALGKLGNIKAHFGAGVDPDPGEIHVGNIPFFYTDRFSSRVLKSVTGPKLWVRTTDELPIEELGLDVPPIDLGWSVGCATAAIAAHLGCNPIIFYGMDLADEKDPIEVVDKWGKQIKSRKDLIMSAKWLGELIQRYSDRTWIDATPEGLEILGAQKRALGELELGNIVHRAVEFDIYPVSIDKQKILDSIARCQKLCVDPAPAAVYEIECERFFQRHLKPLWQLWKPVLYREGSETLQAMLFYKRILQAYE